MVDALLREKRWKTPGAVPASFFTHFPEYPRPIAELLYHRGVHTQDAIDEFFGAEYAHDIHDPYLFTDMAKAVERIVRAIRAKEKITVYGDYDADGVSGSVVLMGALSALDAVTDVYIPDRFHEGYGLNRAALERVIAGGARVIITIDCGITDAEEIAYARAQGIDVIVVDHHLVPEVPPPAYAILNPKHPDERYPFKYLCATGVAFKLACALLASDDARARGIRDGFEKWLLDIVAIGSVADMVPLVGENRTLVKYGLIVLAKTQRLGLRKLLALENGRARGLPQKRDSSGNAPITSETIAFSLAPRINATSRMGHATTSFNLLVAEDETEAEQLAQTVEGLNNERRRAVDKILKEAEIMIADETARAGVLPAVLVLGKDEWPAGVVGLVSGRLTERYGRPSFVYGRTNDHLKGSCRGIGEFHVVEAMQFCQKQDPELLLDLGGHPMAGGFSLAPEKAGALKKLLTAYGAKKLAGNALQPITAVDAEIMPDEISWELFDWLLRFEPFGEGNRKPVFLMRGCEVYSARSVGKKEDHLKITLRTPLKNGTLKLLSGIGFGLSENGMRHCEKGEKVDIVFELEANEWNGTRELQLKLKDLRKSS